MKYYVYELWDSVTDTPIYVGYGLQNRKSKTLRHEDHIKEAIAYEKNPNKRSKHRNLYKIHAILKILRSGGTITFKTPFIDLSYTDALALESQLIAKYGQKCIGTGPLTNIDPGGRGGQKRSPETCRKISESHKGVQSPLKGRVIGEYSQVRKDAIKKGVAKYLQTNEGKQQRKNIGQRARGKSPWNAGQTKLTDDRIMKYARSKLGKPRPDMIGNTPWNAGKNKYTDPKVRALSEKLKGRKAWNKGKASDAKGKTYEEIYGPEVAARMRAARSNKIWMCNGATSQKVEKDKIDEFLAAGWQKGRRPRRGPQRTVWHKNPQRCGFNVCSPKNR